MAENFICIKKCFLGDNLYSIGQPILPGVKPNHHFMDTEGKSFKMPKEIKIVVAGDDPRSTVKIYEDIKLKYGVDVDEDTPRKDAFALWIKLEKSGNDAAPAKKTKKGTVKKTSAKKSKAKESVVEDDAEPVKPLSQWTPDEIDAVKLSDLGKMFSHPYKQGMSKEDFLEQILNLE